MPISKRSFSPKCDVWRVVGTDRRPLLFLETIERSITDRLEQ